jgi:N-methylhydantoinase B
LDTDIISLSVIQKALENIAEEMGVVLRRASFSANCKERLDFSCAIFNSNGELVAQAEHIPVHLGAMFSSMEVIKEQFELSDLHKRDIIVLNSPYSGGTHLPDISFVMPIFIENELTFFVTNRAHHSDIGGSTPGSMPGISTELFQEGLIIPPVKLYNRGKEVTGIMNMILANVRVKEERLGDFRAQRAALLRGEERLLELAGKYGKSYLLKIIQNLMELSEKAFNEHLRFTTAWKCKRSSECGLFMCLLCISSINRSINYDQCRVIPKYQGRNSKRKFARSPRTSSRIKWKCRNFTKNSGYFIRSIIIWFS